MAKKRRACLGSAFFAVTVLIGGPTAAQSLAYNNAPPPFPFFPPLFAQPQIQPEPAREPVEAKPDSGAEVPPHLRRQIVSYSGKEPAGTIVVDTPNTYLYYVLGNGQAVRYGIGVGRDGFRWSGIKTIDRKAEWPDWTPPPEMVARQPYLPRFVAGGPHNPLGARALYLGGTIYRIHGTNVPSSIGQRVSSGCIRMLNEDVIDLYERAKLGTRVVVLPDARYTIMRSSERQISAGEPQRLTASRL
jgi:lipoprotein-anchoring transpeptidase ErfK/SrfK